MIRKLVLGIAVLCVGTGYAFAQDPEEKKEEKKEGSFSDGLFTGGSVTVSFFNQQTILGANPMLGHTIADWIDAGLVFNYIYSGARDWQYYDDKIRQTIIGPGVFTRIYPIPIIF